jgi:hypothetical protein
LSPHTEPFADVDPTPRGHLALLFYQAVYRIVHHLYSRAVAADGSLDAVFEEFPFLAAYFRAISACLPDDLSWDEGAEWLDDATQRWERAGDAWLPLCAVEGELEIERPSLLALVTTGLVEEDLQFGSLFSTLQQPLGERRPTLGLLHELLDPGATSDAWTLVQPLLAIGLIEATNPEAPRAEWVLRVPLPLWSACRGELATPPVPALVYHSPAGFAAVDELLLPEAQAARLAELGGLIAAGAAPTVVVRGGCGSERLEVLAALARTQCRGLMEVSGSAAPAVLGPLCTLARSMPVFSFDPGPGETAELPRLEGYRGPVGVVLGREGGVVGARADHPLTFELEPDPPERRLQRWRAAFEGRAIEDLEGISERFLLPARYLRRSAHLAVSYAALDGRDEVTHGDVRKAVRGVNRQSLDSLAEWLRVGADWSQLVVASPILSELRGLQSRCRHRERLPAVLGENFPGGIGRGVRALFEGPSGSGKTLAARVLATELGLDLYRVDLAAVVNKYIGETEKNLGRLLSRAEELDVVLLLDEGDALMGKRTEVKSANDRYANLETDYLLQRLESYTGIVIVTTNLGRDIDPAFRRRMDATVQFKLPDAQERFELWRIHLPNDHRVPLEELRRIALRYALSGGQIRNAAVQAALTRLEQGDGRVGSEAVEQAIRNEYRKGGEVYPVDERPGPDPRESSFAAFLGAVS